MTVVPAMLGLGAGGGEDDDEEEDSDQYFPTISYLSFLQVR